MTQHQEKGWTLGSWRVPIDQPMLVRNANGLCIADCSGLSFGADTKVANARLISASPDLYEALAEMVEEKADYMVRNNLGDPEREHTIKLARAALAKARGATP